MLCDNAIGIRPDIASSVVMSTVRRRPRGKEPVRDRELALLLALIRGSAPAITFGTETSALRPTLSDAPLSNFETFRATGVINQIGVSVGVSWRFQGVFPVCGAGL